MNKKVAVIGLGYVGLPLALLFAKKNYTVIGLDIDVRKIEALKQGKSYIPDVCNDVIQSEKNFQAYELKKGICAFQACDYVVVTVPTPITENHNPDLGPVISASTFLKEHMVKGQTVIYESSTYPGTLEEVVLPILKESDLQAGVDFYLAYSPERVDPANKSYDIEYIPKVISGYSKDCLYHVQTFYESIFQQVVPVSSPKVAEMCKLFENIQRLVNISLVNETNELCEELGIDFHEVLQAASTKPFGFTPYYPGPGIGGHCIPVDPLYFLWKLKQNGLTSELIEAAHHINEEMPNKVIRRVEKQIAANEKRVFVVGMAYKKDVNDMRESPALTVCEGLLAKGYELTYHDPYIESAILNKQTYFSVPLTKEEVKKSDVVLVLTDHSQIDWSIVKYAKKVVDTRGILNE
ncbi:nucleotide sugar dehydrogenase [Priestia megaterium]|uniref:nucleotide sugar dehydrogenase n=1 Tax=Priestia megaterium TaxID=1404 RepID=UPI000BF64582|nr:nucleotide sugar dehydrogenase [Priestia megaterium]PFE00968.1 UDP-N-acetyl-D-mannosamine dehydrogenase [Priestia megaterium]PGY53454.1 UDP-N-acetyl-D-mannosamine dehydrogenase [Priestia megaterium]